MKKLQAFKDQGEKPTLEAALQRIGDTEGLKEAKGATMSLSTPIVSSQDGPRMAGTGNFGGKKAAPFKKGGGRRLAVDAKKAAIKKRLFGKKG